VAAPQSIMAGDSAKKIMAQNAEYMSRYRLIILVVNVRVCHTHTLPRHCAHSLPSGPCACQALYIAYRMYYLWESFTRWHMGGFALTTTIYVSTYALFSTSATPKRAPLKDGGKIISGGTDLNQSGLIECAATIRWREVDACTARHPSHAHARRAALRSPRRDVAAHRYAWDLLYWNILVQLGSGFVSDVFWLLHLVPPTIGFYFLWTKVALARARYAASASHPRQPVSCPEPIACPRGLQVIYPWISKPDPEAEEPDPQMARKGERKVKYGKAR
jgi:hypothetical protein